MKAEIISIGTELLLGHIVNTNAAFLSRRLAENGIDLYFQSAIGDNPFRLAESVKKALARSDLVITTGGLGPTVDDITVETVAKLADKKLVLNKIILKDLKNYFRLKGIRLPPDSIRQAHLPEGARYIRNKVGTAPGLIIEHDKKIIACLPGPPRELGPIFEKMLPFLKKRSGRQHVIQSLNIKTTGLAESQVNAKIKDILKLPPPTTVGIYAGLGEVDVRITTKTPSKKEASINITKLKLMTQRQLEPYIFGYDDEELEEAVGKMMLRDKITIAVAESCTGGLLSSRLTDVSGSSEYLLMSVVAYSNAAKTKLLGVSKEIIARHGAVSKEVALAMAHGIRQLAGSSIGISITGIAGPTGGTKKKPVGLVYIALVKDKKTAVKEFRFTGSRQEIKFQASQVALNLIRTNL